jgi:hypothetical protein
MPVDLPPPAIFQGLIERGYTPVQAAALAGNIQQESNFNPAALNSNEGANGLLQWRLDRWKALQDFAAQRGTSPTDPSTQLDFIGQEMHGSEANAAKAFLSAQDLPSANAALRKYIRYGDNSEGDRLKYASAFLGQQPQAAQQMATPTATQGAPTSPPISGPAPQPQFAPQAAPSQAASLPASMPMPQTPQPIMPRLALGAPQRPPPDLARIQYVLSQLPPEIRGFSFRNQS